MFPEDVFVVIRQYALASLVVTNPSNINFILSASIENRSVYLIIDRANIHVATYSMYESQIHQIIKDRPQFNLHILSKDSKLSDLILRLVGNNAKVGFEKNDLKYSEYQSLANLNKFELVETVDVIENLRQKKSSIEIKKIANAVKHTKKVISDITDFIKGNSHKGLSEIQIANQIKRYFLDLEGDEGFSTIVASGPNSAFPHHNPTNSLIGIDSHPLLIDLGFKKDMYSGDLTRVLYSGKDKKVLDAIKIVNDCKNHVIEKITPGISFSQLHEFAIKYFDKYKMSEYFIHSIGHGLGLDIHEKPFANDTNALEEGMVITIEPGLYFPNQFGIRDEDVAVVTSNGCKVL